MIPKVFIDGAAGTTGLEIRERLTRRRDVELIALPEAERKDMSARQRALNTADAVILCLPDDAAREAVALIENADTRVIDASSAHRVDSNWAYGFAELEPGGPERLSRAMRISNPGCYPTGFLALIRPLVRAGLIAANLPLSVSATSGYSGGGKAMIAAFEQPESPDGTDTAFRIYALGLGHKHVAEMRVHAGLSRAPVFLPAVARTYRGMLVEVGLHHGRAHDIRDAIADAYRGSALVRMGVADSPVLTIERCAATDRLELFVFADEAAGQVRLIAALDNLGKGAAGAAVQNLNLALRLDELAGLRT